MPTTVMAPTIWGMKVPRSADRPDSSRTSAPNRGAHSGAPRLTPVCGNVPECRERDSTTAALRPPMNPSWWRGWRIFRRRLPRHRQSALSGSHSGDLGRPPGVVIRRQPCRSETAAKSRFRNAGRYGRGPRSRRPGARHGTCGPTAARSKNPGKYRHPLPRRRGRGRANRTRSRSPPGSALRRPGAAARRAARSPQKSPRTGDPPGRPGR